MTTNADRGDRGSRYHHGELRETLMALACAEIAQVGTEKLSLRALARAAGVSPTAPYRHFPSKRCLFAALAAEGFHELRTAMWARVGSERSDAVGALAQAGFAYVDYARAEPVKYHLMFGGVLGDFSEYEELAQRSTECFEVIDELLREGRERGLLVDAPLEELAGTTWAAVHGLANLLIDKGRQCEQTPRPLPAPLRAVECLVDHPEHAVVRLLRSVVADPAHLAGIGPGIDARRQEERAE